MKKINEYLVIPYRFALLLLFYELQRVVFYLLNVDLFASVRLQQWPTLLSGGLKFDVCALLYLNIIFFVLYIFAFRYKINRTYSRVVDCIFWIVNGIGFMFNTGDMIYYRYILKRTTSSVADILQGESNLLQLCFQFMIDFWYMFIAFGLFMWLFVWLTKRVAPVLTPIKNNFLYALTGVLVFAVIAVLSVGGIRGDFKHSTRPITLSNAAAYVEQPEQTWIVLNTPFCIMRTLGKKGLELQNFFTEDELQSLYNPVQTTTVNRNAQEQRKNVVVFIMESFSREFVGSLNHTDSLSKPFVSIDNYKGFTPFLDSLARHSLVFTNAFANGRKSIDAMPSVLSSIPSLTLPYVVSEYSNNKVNSIASILGREGYSTAFFHGAPNGSMGFDAFANTAKFQHYFGLNEYGELHDAKADFDGNWGIWDHLFLPYMAKQIANMPEPFCAALFSLSSHHPFKIHKDFEGVFPKGNLPVEECIGYSDNALRMFFNYARTQSWYDNTLFVITADHSSIPDHTEYANNAQAFAVPLIFFCPSDNSLRGVDNIIAQQADIMPTVLGYVGTKEPYEYVAFGNNLLTAKSDDRFALNYNSGIYQYYTGDYIFYFDGKQITAIYNLRADADLKTNLLSEFDSELLSMYTNKCRAYLQQYNNRMIQNRLSN